MLIIAITRGAIARISCRLMLSVVILRAKGLDAGIRHYEIEMSAMEEHLSGDTFVRNTIREQH